MLNPIRTPSCRAEIVQMTVDATEQQGELTALPDRGDGPGRSPDQARHEEQHPPEHGNRGRARVAHEDQLRRYSARDRDEPAQDGPQVELATPARNMIEEIMAAFRPTSSGVYNRPATTQ